MRALRIRRALCQLNLAGDHLAYHSFFAPSLTKRRRNERRTPDARRTCTRWGLDGDAGTERDRGCECYAHTHICTHTRTHSHSHTHTLTHSHTHTHTHTLTHSRTHTLAHSHTHTLAHSHTRYGYIKNHRAKIRKVTRFLLACFFLLSIYPSDTLSCQSTPHPANRRHIHPTIHPSDALSFQPTPYPPNYPPK